jgi:hypothetical protein
MWSIERCEEALAKATQALGCTCAFVSSFPSVSLECCYCFHSSTSKSRAREGWEVTRTPELPTRTHQILQPNPKSPTCLNLPCCPPRPPPDCTNTFLADHKALASCCIGTDEFRESIRRARARCLRLQQSIFLQQLQQSSLGARPPSVRLIFGISAINISTNHPSVVYIYMYPGIFRTHTSEPPRLSDMR